jgi:tRNA (adenine57-N1/adenine58-N1)-methyltransferase
MFHARPRISEGDLVIIYEDFRTMSSVRVKPPQVFHSRFGKFPHSAMIGHRFGERMSAVSAGGSSGGGGGGGGGYVYLLSPSPELWTATLSHRTQILYIADISMIVLQLELVPGSVVVEAGTGSGSLSHALARAVGTQGHLHTFEFNAQRAKLAQGEFVANGLAERVTCRHGDVCEEGWSYAEVAGLQEGSVDAAIFDLPNPEVAVRKVSKYMAPGGRLCSFSPCIEQVARTMDALRETGFTRCEVVEVIVRSHELTRPHPGQATDAITSAVEKAAALRREAAQISSGHGEAEGAAGAASSAPEEGATEGATEAAQGGVVAADAGAEPGLKRPRLESAREGGATGGAEASSGNMSGHVAAPPPPRAPPPPAPPPAATALRTRPNADMRGHTGFLVFCSMHVG